MPSGSDPHAAWGHLPEHFHTNEEVAALAAERDRLVGALLTHITNAKIAEGYHYKAAQALAQGEVARVREADA